jgi:hypothetical protein
VGEGKKGQEEEEAGGNDLALSSTSLSTTTNCNTRGREEGGEIDHLLLPSLNRVTAKVLLRCWGRAGNVCCKACEAQRKGGGDGNSKHLDNLVATSTTITTGPPPPPPPDPTIIGNFLVGGDTGGKWVNVTYNSQFDGIQMGSSGPWRMVVPASLMAF